MTHLFHVDIEGASRLTLGADAGSDLLVLALLERAEYEVTLAAVVLDEAELWQNARRAGHHTRRLHQLVQVKLPAMVRWTN